MRRNKWHCKPCDKTAFPSQRAAERAIENIRNGQVRGAGPKRAYQCSYGNGWHLTSKDYREEGCA